MLLGDIHSSVFSVMNPTRTWCWLVMVCDLSFVPQPAALSVHKEAYQPQPQLSRPTSLRDLGSPTTPVSTSILTCCPAVAPTDTSDHSQPSAKRSPCLEQA
jgi:hypothetical protein